MIVDRQGQLRADWERLKASSFGARARIRTAVQLSVELNMTPRRVSTVLRWAESKKLAYVYSYGAGSQHRCKYWAIGGKPSVQRVVKNEADAARQRKNKCVFGETVILPLLPATARHIGNKLRMSPSGVYYHLTRLEASGKVVRSPKPSSLWKPVKSVQVGK